MVGAEQVVLSIDLPNPLQFITKKSLDSDSDTIRISSLSIPPHDFFRAIQVLAWNPVQLSVKNIFLQHFPMVAYLFALLHIETIRIA